jgi:hypothetical protein
MGKSVADFVQRPKEVAARATSLEELAKADEPSPSLLAHATTKGESQTLRPAWHSSLPLSMNRGHGETDARSEDSPQEGHHDND